MNSDELCVFIFLISMLFPDGDMVFTWRHIFFPLILYGFFFGSLLNSIQTTGMRKWRHVSGF